jgi:hypothetical protein
MANRERDARKEAALRGLGFHVEIIGDAPDHVEFVK